MIKDYFIRQNTKSIDLKELDRQLDTKSEVQESLIKNSEKLDSVLKSFMASSIAINAVASVSLKQIFKSVKIAQLITYMVMLEINFTPINLIFLKALF